MSIASEISRLTSARNTIRTKMIAASQATASDTLDTLATNLTISASGVGYKIVMDTPDEELFGQTVTIKQGTTTVGTTTFSNTGHAEYTVQSAGTYIISVTYDGKTTNTEVTVSDTSIEIRGVLNYEDWLTAGGLDPDDYDSLSAVLADEEAVRQLMTVHASVDYLCAFF